MHFQIIGNITEIETIATSSGIREINADLPQPVRRAVLQAA